MAEWTDIDPNTLLPGEPWTSAKALAAFENPVAIAHSQNGMGLIPSLFTVAEHQQVTLMMSAVAMMAPTEETVRDKYTEAITGIQLPDKRILLG